MKFNPGCQSPGRSLQDYQVFGVRACLYNLAMIGEACAAEGTTLMHLEHAQLSPRSDIRRQVTVVNPIPCYQPNPYCHHDSFATSQLPQATTQELTAAKVSSCGSHCRPCEPSLRHHQAELTRSSARGPCVARCHSALVKDQNRSAASSHSLCKHPQMQRILRKG